MAKRNRQQREDYEMKSEIEIYEAEKSRNKEQIDNVIKNFKFKPFKPSMAQKTLFNKIKENEINFVSGPAGTGKTMATLKIALELLAQDNCYEKILITKPIIEAVEEMGFLPGGIDSKTDPYIHSFQSNLCKLIDGAVVKKLFDSGVIKFVPTSFMRGETFSNAIAILDEAQNTTFLGLKLFLTRKAETSKLIIMGDTDQSDLNLRNSEIMALEDAFTRFKGIKGISFMEFKIKDMMRSKILVEILGRYEKKTFSN